jgi:hypothetical protein
MLEQYDLHGLLVIDITTVPQYPFCDITKHFQKLSCIKTSHHEKQNRKSFYRNLGILPGFLLLFSFFSANAQSQDSLPKAAYIIEGVGIIKSNLLAEVAKFDSAMVFTRAPNIGVQPNVIGNDDNNGSLQLVGEERKLVLVKWTFIFKDINFNKTGVTRMAQFAFAMDRQPCVDWLVDKIRAVNKDRYHAFKEDKLFFYDFTRGEITYDPATLTLTLSFVPSKLSK